MGHLFRAITKRGIEAGLVTPVGPPPTINGPALKELALMHPARFDPSIGQLTIAGFHDAELAALDHDLDVDNCVSFVALHQELRRELAPTRRGIRQAAEAAADIVVTSEVGYYPRAQLNFYLAIDRMRRTQRFRESLMPRGQVVDIESLIQSTQDRDAADLRNVLSESLPQPPAYLRADDPEDPGHRLKRYSGRFYIIDANDLTYTDVVEGILPTVLAEWLRLQEGTHHRERLLRSFHFDRARFGVGRLSLLMLKGGTEGGHSGLVNAKILRRLARHGHFHYALGAIAHDSMEAALRRWDRVRQWCREILQVFETDPTTDAHCIHWAKELLYRCEGDDPIRTARALDHLAGIPHQNEHAITLVRRLKFFLGYVLQESQYILLWRNTSRGVILEDWGLDRLEVAATINSAFPQRVDTRELEDLDEQDFVKTVLVGDGESQNAAAGTLRRLVHEEMAQGSLQQMAHEALYRGVTKADLFAVANAVHGPAGPAKDELPRELALLPQQDVMLFDAFVRMKLPALG